MPLVRSVDARATAPGWPWGADDVIAAFADDVIVRAPGAPAEFDEDAIRAEIAGSGVRILLLPYLSQKDRDAARDDSRAMRSWAAGRGLTLITVSGVSIDFSAFTVSPDAVAEAERLLAHQDIGHDLRFAISRATAEDGEPLIPEPANVVPTPWVAADEALVATVVTALRNDRVWTHPSLEPVTPLASWDAVGPDRIVRAAFLPARRWDEPRVDLITPLAAAFPGDLVLVLTGRWVDIAGPDDAIQRSAVTYLYGGVSESVNLYSSPVEQAGEVRFVCTRIGLLRTGVTTDQPSPPREDPQGSIAPVLGWVFLGTATVVGGAAWFELRRKGVAKERALQGERAARRRRDRLAADLPAIAADLLDLDGLARDGEAGEALSRAAERYGVTRDLLARNGDVDVAAEAVDVARTELATARREVDGRTRGRR